MVVSVGQQINTFELKAIASDPDERNIFQVERISELPNLISQIPGALCNGKTSSEGGRDSWCHIRNYILNIRCREWKKRYWSRN